MAEKKKKSIINYTKMKEIMNMYGGLFLIYEGVSRSSKPGALLVTAAPSNFQIL